MSHGNSFKTFLILTDGMSREGQARLLGVSARTLSRYENGEVQPSRKVMSKIETVVLRAQMAVVDDDDKHLMYRMEELRRNREASARLNPVRSLAANEKVSDLPPLWELCAAYVDDRRYDEAWLIGSRLVEAWEPSSRLDRDKFPDGVENQYLDLVSHICVPDEVKPYCLGYVYVAAAYTGRTPEALEFVKRALKACSPEQHPLYETILSNKGEFLAQIGRFEEAYVAVDRALKVDKTFMLALYNALCIACMDEKEKEVVYRRDRLMEQVNKWPRHDLDKLLEWLRIDPNVKWGCEQGLIQPLIDELNSTEEDLT